MSNIASAKFNSAWTRLQHARALTGDFEKVVYGVCEEPTDTPMNPRYYVFGSDGGLCGSVNTLLVRHVTALHQEEVDNGANPSYVMCGEKIRIGMTPKKQFQGHLSLAITQAYKAMNPLQIGVIADELATLEPADKHVFTYQRMVNQHKFVIHTESMPTKQQITSYHGITEFEGDNDVYDNLSDYMTYLSLWKCCCEQEASELASRSQAMQNASKAAGDMIDDLELKYRKRRQEKMTTEIIEISTGAAASEASNNDN